MQFSETTKNIFKALSEFKKDFKQPLKDADNPFFKSKYVPLESVVQMIDNVAPKHGLSYFQSTVTDEIGRAGVITVITHESGEYIELDPLYLKLDKQTAQGAGSAITYARRYSLSSAFGVASDVDDDGNQATQDTNNHVKEAIKSGYAFLKKLGVSEKEVRTYVIEQARVTAITKVNDDEHLEILRQLSSLKKKELEK